jgi:hypothetical protein
MGVVKVPGACEVDRFGNPGFWEMPYTGQWIAKSLFVSLELGLRCWSEAVLLPVEAFNFLWVL